MSIGTIISIRALQIYFNTIGRLFENRAAQQLLRLFSTPRSKVIREKEIEILTEAKKEEITIDGHQIATYQWGDGKKNALLCHGWESNAGSLGAFVPLLLKMDYKVISYDGPAHGKSDGKSANLFEFTKVAYTINKQFGPATVFIGHSLGADVVMLLSKEYKLQIDKCILISPVNEVQHVFDGFKKIFAIPKRIHHKMLLLIEKESKYQIDEMVFDKIVKESKIKEALILHDIDDKVTPFSHAENLNKNWKDSRLVPIHGSGHYKVLWHEASLVAVEDFLNN